MNTIDTSHLLSQLRLATAQAQNSRPTAAPITTAAPDQAAPSRSNSSSASEAMPADFSQLLKQSVDKVNAMQQQSSSMQEAFQLGDPNLSLADVMIAKNKSGLAFDGMIQVRNKMIEAYREVMRMQV